MTRTLLGMVALAALATGALWLAAGVLLSMGSYVESLPL